MCLIDNGDTCKKIPFFIYLKINKKFKEILKFYAFLLFFLTLYLLLGNRLFIIILNKTIEQDNRLARDFIMFHL